MTACFSLSHISDPTATHSHKHSYKDLRDVILTYFLIVINPQHSNDLERCKEELSIEMRTSLQQSRRYKGNQVVGGARRSLRRYSLGGEASLLPLRPPRQRLLRTNSLSEGCPWLLGGLVQSESEQKIIDHCDSGCDRNKNLVSNESRVEDENRQTKLMNDIIPECPIDCENNGENESHLSNNKVTGGDDENNNKVPRETSPIGKSLVFYPVFSFIFNFKNNV